MMKKLFLILIVGVFLFGVVDAGESGGVLRGEMGECVQLPQECASCTYSKLTKIVYPDLSIDVINTMMTKDGTAYNYTFCDTNTTGDYSYCTVSDVDTIDTVACKPFIITSNGRAPPSGIVIVLFSILFLIILVSLVTLVLYTLAHTVEKDFDVKDLIFNISAYLVLWGIYILAVEYLGNVFINIFLEWLIGVCALTNVILPLIIFIISITIWKWREELEGKF